MNTIVQSDRDGRLFVEVDDIRYTADDLPPEGTDVEVEPYTGINDCRYADVTWSAETPSGYCDTTAEEIW